MPAIGEKVAYILGARQTRSHECHWPGCVNQVPPAMFMCRSHWFSLPKPLRQRIWAAYRRGQEETMDPSAEYIAAAHAAQDWIAETYPKDL